MVLNIFLGIIAVVIALCIIIPLFFRRVVETNEVHIVQSSNKTVSYGKDTGNGNTYYEFPSWVPIFGITKIVLPVSVFAIKIDDYEAYDLGRLPFVVDITAFFRIEDSNLAAQRVESFEDLQIQLTNIIQGSIRSILSSRALEDILQIRSELGDDFTKAVKIQLQSWGIEPVKNIELMDIRDSSGSKVIFNIMEKKKSEIEKESRIEVANNLKLAQIAEIEAVQATEVKQQDANKIVGLKTVENEREVAISKELANQLIKDQEKITKEKEMEVVRVKDVKEAEIKKQVEIVRAEQDQRKIEIDAEARKNAKIKDAEAIKENQILVAQGDKEKQFLAAAALLEMKDKEAQGTLKIGSAEAEALRLKELAPVNAQIELAKEIGENEGYQTYLISIKQIEANRDIGLEQAKALSNADLKIIANEGNVASGVNKIGDVLSSKGGTNLASMLEGLNQSEIGKKIIDKFTGKKEE
ncbi:SPFH domain-containing protein [Campylobacter ureolyticus]|uniref:SPFH domain-containing protein n=1 Tax=Campylobacter ureolyticus TaxID=827 RepID=A0A9Q4PT14_9BACT|nr:SPFH domain-containing protein [Campylobacter ureolyticus]MCZ6156385.1 SPFH domain-containing protein [Campylobacter ureolyticus]MCZ6159339.1 SPFH domain-containing protein [Campylobacter ureolyticus]MCZ6162669.1 SPFH domain-containing protein [Campylobacter ureolyticus]MCZ6164838.1 SPFH domain-containing protein [Campylobacter ureolyticus]MCZ6166636.1 SPFH domain-containing protein [Campylobacter ureolyticus]